MKKVLVVILVCFFASCLFAMEEELVSFSVKDYLDNKINVKVTCLDYQDAKFAMYFTNADTYSFLGIEPFGIIVTEEYYPMFMTGINKFFEWIDVANQNSVTSLDKSIPVDGEDTLFDIGRFYNGGYITRDSMYFTFKKNGSSVQLIMNVFFGYSTQKFYFDQYQVEKLRTVLSEENLNKTLERISAKEKQKDLFY